MRLNVHDFSGHPFQVQLSRELARRGHSVLHEYSTQYVTGHGDLEVHPSDPIGLRIEGVAAAHPMRKYDPLGRLRFERSYARAWQRRLEQEHFDLVVACNVPMFALASMRRYFARRQQPWVMWHQDIYSLGIGSEIDRKLPAPLARPAREFVARIERAQVRSADGVVAIHDNFVRHYRGWGLSTEHVEVIENWAPLDDVAPGERDNAWADEHGLPSDSLRLLYAGTLGRKHNPLLLLELLDATRAKGIDATLVVCSEGVGADELRAAAGERPDVRILGYQPADQFRDVLASADAMVVLLEPDAAAFSVPSKVLSYLAAGRPSIALVPSGNPAAADVRSVGGYVGEPNVAGARGAADWLSLTLAEDAAQLDRLGKAARALAEERFDVRRIAERFEHVLRGAARLHVVPDLVDAALPGTVEEGAA